MAIRGPLTPGAVPPRPPAGAAGGMSPGQPPPPPPGPCPGQMMHPFGMGQAGQQQPNLPWMGASSPGAEPWLGHGMGGNMSPPAGLGGFCGGPGLMQPRPPTDN